MKRIRLARRFFVVVGSALALFLHQPGDAAGQEGGGAGYDGGFYIRDAAGNYQLRFNALLQSRYLYTLHDVEQLSGEEEDLSIGGFQLRRLQLDFQGYFFSPRWTYRFRVDTSNGGTVSGTHVWAAYTPENSLFSIRFGQFKPDFIQEENIGEPGQLSIERSYTNEYFTTDFAKGVQLVGRPWDRLTLTGTVHAGSYSYRSDYTALPTEIAFTGRVGLIPFAGTPARAWSQFGDFQHWLGDQNAVLLGAAVSYELGRTRPLTYPDLLKGVVDAQVEVGGASFYAAAMGQQFSVSGPLASGVPEEIDGARQLALVGQAAFFIVPDRLDGFVRFESIDFGEVYYRLNQGAIQAGSRILPDDRFSVITVGFNHYIRRNNARLTLDVVHALDPVPVADPGNALLRSVEGGQTAIRTQAQLRF